MSLRYSGSYLTTTYDPFKVPGAPVIGVPVAGNEQIMVPFTAPPSIGGSAITSYRVVCSNGTAVTGTTSPLTVGGLTNGVSYTFTIQAINSFGGGPFSAPSSATSPVSAAQYEFTTPGTYTWIAPSGVTSVSVVCVGGGGGTSYGGGGGGGLGYKNNIAVTPGASYTVVVGAGGEGPSPAVTDSATSGGDSWFISSSTVKGGGGGAGRLFNSGTTSSGGAGGTYVGDGGGNGGAGGAGLNSYGGAGNGGAGGYSGAGGAGGEASSSADSNGSAGSGGGGGGGAGEGFYGGGCGGGVGILGAGTSGVGGLAGRRTGKYGQCGTGGSGAGPTDNALRILFFTGDSTNSSIVNYGSGGSSYYRQVGGSAGKGAVRIVWPGNTRAFPSTNVGNI